jgi:hypothetical protein
MSKENATAKSDTEKAKEDYEPKVGEPGYVYNDDGAEIQNPGPRNDPLQGGDKPIGWRLLGDRVETKENPGDKDAGKPLTPKEPGSTSR